MKSTASKSLSASSVPLLLAAFWLIGCGRTEPTPTEVYRQFHDGLASMARGGESGGAAVAYGLLTKASQDHLVGLADALNEQLPAAVERRDPADLLRVRRLKVGGPLESVVEKSVDETKAVLEVRTGEHSQTVTLLREGRAWRVALFEVAADAGASAEPKNTPAAAPAGAPTPGGTL